MSSIETSLQDLSTRHAELVEDKEEVLIDRQRIASSAFSIRTRRDRAKDAEVRLMDMLRRAYNDTGGDVADDMAMIYAEVERLRDELVDAEDKHAELVENLEISEWALIKKEEDLYQRDIPQLIDVENYTSMDTGIQRVVHEVEMERTAMSPSPDLQHHIALENHRRAVRQFRELSRSNIDQMEEGSPISSDLDTNYIGQTTKSKISWGASEVVDHMVKCEVEVLRTRTNMAKRPRSLEIKTRSEPNLTTYFESYLHLGEDSRNTQSETGRHHAEEALSSSLRVENWMLDCLQENVDHKLQFMAVLMGTLGPTNRLYLEYEHWEEDIVQHWNFDMTELAVLQSTKLSMRSSITVCSDSSSSHKHPATVEVEMMFPESLRYEPASASHFHRALNIPHFQIDSHSSMESGHALYRQRVHEPTRLYQVFPGPESDTPPEVRVTAPEGEVGLVFEGVTAMNQLNPMDTCFPRRESAYNSDVEEPQQARAQQIASAEKTTLAIEEIEPRKIVSRQEADIEDSEQLRGNGDGIRYAPWAWSPDLSLHHTLGLNEDGEVIEAIWSQPLENGRGTHRGNRISRKEPSERM